MACNPTNIFFHGISPPINHYNGIFQWSLDPSAFCCLGTSPMRLWHFGIKSSLTLILRTWPAKIRPSNAEGNGWIRYYHHSFFIWYIIITTIYIYIYSSVIIISILPLLLLLIIIVIIYKLLYTHYILLLYIIYYIYTQYIFDEFNMI